MQIEIQEVNDIKIAVVIAEGIAISEVQDAVDILGNSDYMGASRIIVKKENIIPAFFDLKTGIAGEVLQKFSNYNKRLAIVGDFSEFTSKSLKDFIYESNKNRMINFVDTMEEAKERLSKN